MASVDVISSCVVRTTNNPTPISRLDLTPWDLQLLLLYPIQKGILFHNPQNQKIDQNFIHHFKHSLSRTLDFFPPLAGRLASIYHDDNTTSFFVDCNNEGVEFVHAVAPGVSISDILKPTYIPKIVSSFFPLNRIPNCEGVSKPLVGVQVTELVDGIFIGCTANHAVIDGVSFWHFFNSWSEISRGLDTISKTPVFERWFPTSVSNDNCLIRLPPLEKDDCLVLDRPPLLERVFHFSKESLAKLKAKANSEGKTDKISSLQALSAHLWWSAIRCRHSVESTRGNEEADFMMIVGARPRIPLPDGYFGNAALINARMATSEVELLQKGFGYAAVKINELVAQQSVECVVKFVDDWVENPKFARKQGRLPFAITSSPRHNVYGNDFGWGKPIAVRSGEAQKYDGKMTMYPAAIDGGIDVEVCLAEETLQAMGDDAEFMEAFMV